MTIKPIHPDSGQPFTNPDLPDGLSGVVGWCGHRVAEQEWRAGFRVCERDSERDYEPANRTLVLVSCYGRPSAVYVRDDSWGGEDAGYDGTWRWFKVGDDDERPATACT